MIHPDSGGEVIEGAIFIHRNGLRFVSGHREEELAASRILVEFNAEEETLCFKDAHRAGLSIYTRDTGVFDVDSFPQLRHVRGQIDENQGRREVSRSMRLAVYFVLGFMLLAWLFSRGTRALVVFLAAKAPPQWERQFGESALAMLEQKSPVNGYSNQVRELTALAGPLLSVVPQGENPVKFFIVNDPDPNAFALPGGCVVVNSGLLEMTGRPEELLGVLAHELAHVAKKHYARELVSASGSFALFGLFLSGGNGLARVLTSGSGVMLARGFSREYETEADDAGWNYLMAARIDPRGMITLFRKLQTFENVHKSGSGMPQSFNSHPALEKRIARLETKWKRLPPNHDFLQFTNQLPRLENN